MAGKTVSRRAVSHGLTQPLHRPEATDAHLLLSVMSIIHEEPLAAAFNALQKGKVTEIQATGLAHFFEEIGALVIHNLISRDLLFDAFAFDVYWKSLGAVVKRTRKTSHNPKFGENFELMAEMAAEYRQERPPKLEVSA
jgi:hypothetical protein